MSHYKWDKGSVNDYTIWRGESPLGPSEVIATLLVEEGLEAELASLRDVTDNTYNALWSIFYPDRPNSWAYPGQIVIEVRSRLEELSAENERLLGLFEELNQWQQAYPLTIFPEPDFEKAAELLRAGGMTIDAISSSNMRHVLRGIGEIIAKALGEGEQ